MIKYDDMSVDKVTKTERYIIKSDTWVIYDES